MWMIEKRPFWASKVMTGILHILEMKNAIFKNVKVPEKYASHQPAKSCKLFSALEHLKHCILFCFFILLVTSQTHVLSVSWGWYHSSVYFLDINLYRCQKQAAHKSPHSQLQQPANKVNYVGIAPSAASKQNVFIFVRQKLQYQCIAIKFISNGLKKKISLANFYL